MRCFVALDISEEVRSELAGRLGAFQGLGADIRWAGPGQMHLTLQFLGEVEECRRAELEGLLAKAVRPQESFSYHLAGWGAFPHFSGPRVLWVGVDQGEAEVKGLAARVRSALAAAGFPDEEREFSAHLTLGRVKGPGKVRALTEAMRSAPFSSAHEVRADHLTLYKSTLTSQGSVYEALFKAAFKT